MALPVLLGQPNLPPLPDDEVEIRVEVDRTHCAATDPSVQTRIGTIEGAGFRVPISRIICYAAADFHGGVRDVYGAGEDRTRIIAAWQELVHWSPTSKLGRDGVPRLVVDPLPNPGRKGRISELLGVGVGLCAARIVFQRSFRFWQNQGHARFDYRAPSPTGSGYLAEVRGRFGRNGWAAAKNGVYQKLAAATGTCSHAAGFIYAPRKTPNANSADLCIVDPDGDEAPLPLAEERALVRHYSPYFGNQGGVVGAFGDRLLALAAMADEEFNEYLIRGDETLQRLTAFRTSFTIGGERFLGSAWEGDGFPRHLTGALPTTGFFIEGVWSAVVDALREGRLRDVAEMDVRERCSRDGEFVYVVVDDARAYAWAPTLPLLMEMP